MVTRLVEGSYQRTLASPGTIWLSPAGVKEDLLVTSSEMAEIVHLYLPANPFQALGTVTDLPALEKAELLCCAGFHDPVIEQIAEIVLSEMRSDSSAGRILIRSVALSLTAWLLHRYSTLTRTAGSPRQPQLDRRRLQLVLAFIETHIESDITVAQLAATARLSEAHFSRAFKLATNRSPYRYVSDRRLKHAKWLLAETDRPLTEIGRACRFSSLGNFSRAFHRATGMTPSTFRKRSGRFNAPL
jgi:AraC family transcriptional regulator